MERKRKARAVRATPCKLHALLLLEPEGLLRWSIITYLGRWFRVLSADSAESVERMLEEYAVDGIVVSDNLPRETCEIVTRAVRARNTSARVVRTVTTIPSNGGNGDGTVYLEKPFELATLARLMGASEARVEEKKR